MIFLPEKGDGELGISNQPLNIVFTTVQKDVWND